jgi:excisionase family DNA binding protein
VTNIEVVDDSSELSSLLVAGLGTEAHRESTALNDTPARDPAEYLMTPAEVAQIFRVDPKTVSRWAMSGRVGSVRTPGGHRRFHRGEVAALLAGLTQPGAEQA